MSPPVKYGKHHQLVQILGENRLVDIIFGTVQLELALGHYSLGSG